MLLGAEGRKSMSATSRAVPVSVIILAYNEEDKIEDCIRSVIDWAGEVFLVDSGSVDRTRPDTPAIRAEKRGLIDSAGRPRLIYVSHPSEHKNHNALVAAMRGITERYPSASLMLTLDRDNLKDARYRGFVEDIRKVAREHGVSDHLVWLGILGPDEVSAALESSDLMVFPSLAESFGLGLVESMAADCPIAAADLPYAHDVAGDAAVYFDPLDPTSIARTVTSTLSDEGTMARLREAGHSRKALFAYPAIAERVAQILQGCASNQAYPPPPAKSRSAKTQ